jgi:hypothetical protein
VPTMDELGDRMKSYEMEQAGRKHDLGPVAFNLTPGKHYRVTIEQLD